MATETTETKTPPAPQSKDYFFEWLKPVLDPEINLPLVDLGLIYDAQYVSDEKKVKITMTLTSPACPAGDVMISDIKNRLNELDEVSETEVEIVWEPKWNPAEMASEEAKETLGIW